MQITLEIPDELASSLTGPGQDPARAALEACGDSKLTASAASPLTNSAPCSAPPLAGTLTAF